MRVLILKNTSSLGLSHQFPVTITYSWSLVRFPPLTLGCLLVLYKHCVPLIQEWKVGEHRKAMREQCETYVGVMMTHLWSIE